MNALISVLFQNIYKMTLMMASDFDVILDCTVRSLTDFLTSGVWVSVDFTEPSTIPSML